MPYNTSPATDASAIAIWVFSVQKAEMVEREKELVTVGVAMVSCCLEVNCFVFKNLFFCQKRFCRKFAFIGVIQSLIKKYFAVRIGS